MRTLCSAVSRWPGSTTPRWPPRCRRWRSILSERDSLFKQGLLSNRPLLAAVALTLVLQLATVYLPLLQPIFRTTAPPHHRITALSAVNRALCFALAALVLIAAEAGKAG